MNDFGLPMTDADINMAANPVKADLQMKLSTTGVVNNWVFGAAGLALGVGSSLWGGSKAAGAARRGAELHNEAMERKYDYDMKGWQARSQKLIADRAHMVEQVAAQQRWENDRADYTDAMNARKYQYDLQIRNRQQQSNEDQFARSEDVYATQTDLNAMSAQTAYEDEARQLEEIRKERIFDQQDAYLNNLLAEGKLRATGVEGRSAQKGYQVTAYDFGTTVEQLDEAFAGAGANSRAAMKAIATDLKSADLAAYAQRMLDPGDIPLPLEHLEVARQEFVMPRALGQFDFGPKPIMGLMQDPNAAASAVWGNTIASIGGQVGGYVSKFSWRQPGADGSPGGLYWGDQKT